MVTCNVFGCVFAIVVLSLVIVSVIDEFVEDKYNENTHSFVIWWVYCGIHDREQIERFNEVKDRFTSVDRIEIDEFGAMYGNSEYTAVYGEGDEESYVVDSNGSHVVEGLAPTLKIIKKLKFAKEKTTLIGK